MAAADGSFSVTVPVGFGSDVLTVAAAAPGNRTGYAQTSVTSDVTSGTKVLNVTDPTGDDNGPGNYQYPTAADFHPGAFDLTDFRVISDGTTVYLQATLATWTRPSATRSGRNCSTCTCTTPGAATDLDGGGLPDPQLHHRPGGRLE